MVIGIREKKYKTGFDYNLGREDLISMNFALADGDADGKTPTFLTL